MTPVHLASLVLVALVLAPVVLARSHRGVDDALARISIAAFGDSVAEFRAEHPNRRAALESAHVAATYREYGSKTYLYAGVAAITASVLGVYAIWGLLALLPVDTATLEARLPGTLEFLASLARVPALSALEVTALFASSTLTLGVVAAFGTYWLRWWYPAYVANERARRIDATLPETVALLYALSKSGMEFSKIVRIAAENADTYGAAADEFAVAVRNVDTFGMDVVTAVEETGRRTASDGFREFTENLVSVLQSGHSLSAFLEDEYRDYREEAQSRQESTVEILATLAEAYVTVLVAGPLFLITILVVIGFSIGETLGPLQVLVYVILPFGNLAFVVYLSTVTDSLDPGRTVTVAGGRADDVTVDATPPTRADGAGDDTDGTVTRLRTYRRFRAVRARLANPLESVVARPRRVLALTLPLAAAVVVADLLRTAGISGALESPLSAVAAIDTTVALATLFVFVTFATPYELHRRRVRAIEAAIPDLLDRLASVNRAGMPIVTAFGHVRGSDLGALGDELDRLWADLEWGGDLASALWRLEARVRTHTTARVVTLLTEAMNASGQLATVLRIAARQAAADRRLERERASAMLEYTVVVYVSFLVFLFIIVILAAYLLPNLPTESVEVDGVGSAVDSSGLGGIDAATAEAYTRLFYHAALVQGVLSGLIAGQLSTGAVESGVKHAAFMLTVALLLFAVLV
ncbi:type II secretion system F family protein [Natronobiforma cellulositropha]|uniref:type II secretion system F family protein n=1 Tax=Natronobiforma cellulositropha TaxID=1679076 RepID=UPI0021D578AB|nr:type II secretion system F family protein [Natronobiforma cellulositropha]